MVRKEKTAVALIVAVFSACSVARAEIVFGPHQLTARHAASSKLVGGAHGMCLETKALMSGNPNYGEIATASLKGLEPGLYEAHIMIEADPFTEYSPAGEAGGSWLYGFTAFRRNGPFVKRPVWWQELAGRKTPLRITVPFEAIDKRAYAVGVAWSFAHKVKGSATVRVYEIAVKRVDAGCFVRKIQPKKMVYRPGEGASASYELVNVKDLDWNGTLLLELVGDVDERQAIGRYEVTVPAGRFLASNFRFNVGDQLFGREIRATLLNDGKAVHSLGEVFTVAANFWDIAQGTTTGGLVAMSGAYGDATPKLVKSEMARMRQRYSTWFEKCFWAPDDWGNLTPQEPEWLSGQAFRWENAKWLKLHIAEAHKQGIKAISYGKGLASGPSAYELLRQKPEFFARDKRTGRWGANADLWDLDNWNDVGKHIHGKGEEKFISNWHRLTPDLSQPEALDHGIHQLIDSATQFGFDGVRFDGQFTAVDDVVSTFNMRRLKERVWAEKPDYLFGFNMGSPRDYPEPFPHEVREGLAGGAHWMNEAVGQWMYDGSKCYTSWREYARTEKAATQRIQAAGGTYHYIYRLGLLTSEAARFYKFAIGTLNAAHDCYGDHESAPGSPNWGKMLTRWGSLFWHPSRKSIEPDNIGVAVDHLPADVEWKLWARSAPLSADRELLVLPFLRLPATDAIHETVTYPAPAVGGRFQLAPDLRARLKDAWWLNPLQDQRHGMARVSMSDDGWTAMPDIAPMGILVMELIGCPGYRPVDRPRFTETVKPADLRKSLASGARKVVVDPLRPELNVAQNGYEKIHRCESEKISWSMMRMVFVDPAASAGKAAGCDKSLGRCVTGGYFFDLSPGRYKIKVRARLTHPGSGHGEVDLYENVDLGRGVFKQREGSMIKKAIPASVLTPEYREIVLTDQYEHYGVGFGACFIHGVLSADAPAEARFLVDWVQAEQLEEYTDETIAAKTGMDAHLHVSVGSANHVLWIRGMYDELYRIDEAIAMALPDAEVDKVYQRHMPSGAKLADYGTVILPNVPVDTMPLKDRKAYSNWTTAGGHLVILGGDYSLGQGLMRKTFFEDILPCHLVRNDDVARMPEHFGLSAADAAQATTAKDSGDRIFFAHVTEAKRDTEVVAACANVPLMMSRKAQKGRCTVFAGTVLGARKDDPAAFWTGERWTEMLANALK